MIIREICIRRYGPLRNLILHPKPGFQVIRGHNESGKTLTIDALLKLLLGSKLQEFENIDRVEQPPEGHITGIIDKTEHSFDGNHTLARELNMESKDFRNLYVVRNKDLSLGGQQEYLQSLTDRITGVETRRLTALRQAVRRLGRLTNPSSGASLSNLADHGKIADRRRQAAELVKDLDAYLESAQEQNLDSLELRLESTRAHIQAMAGEILTQEQARTWEKAQLRQSLETELVSLEAEHEHLAAYGQSELGRLQELNTDYLTCTTTASSFQQELDISRQDLAKADVDLREANTRLLDLDSRQEAWDKLRMQADALTVDPPVGTNLQPVTVLLLLISLSGLVLGALNLITGILLAAPALTTFAALILFVSQRLGQVKAGRYRSRQKQLLHLGARSGIYAETPDQLLTALANLEHERNSVSVTVRNLEQRRQHFHDLNQRLQQRVTQHTTQSKTLAAEIKQLLTRADCPDISTYNIRLEHKRKLDVRAALVRERLEEIGIQPPVTDPAVTYDETLLSNLRGQKEQLSDELAQLQEQLHSHQTAVAKFGARMAAILPGQDLHPKLTDLTMLVFARANLQEYIDETDTSFQAAIETIRILEGIEAEEAARVEDLFSADKPVHRIFARFTGHRYTRVSACPQQGLWVQRRDEVSLPSHQLSQGTLDQLYMAVRLSLGQELLPGGILLLDDPFLCVDSDRLNNMLSELMEQATRGWQILYFTMDDRVSKLIPPLAQLSPLQS